MYSSKFTMTVCNGVRGVSSGRGTFLESGVDSGDNGRPSGTVGDHSGVIVVSVRLGEFSRLINVLLSRGDRRSSE